MGVAGESVLVDRISQQRQRMNPPVPGVGPRVQVEGQAGAVCRHEATTARASQPSTAW